MKNKNLAAFNYFFNDVIYSSSTSTLFYLYILNDFSFYSVYLSSLLFFSIESDYLQEMTQSQDIYVADMTNDEIELLKRLEEENR
jgi:hypothetical protein